MVRLRLVKQVDELLFASLEVFRLLIVAHRIFFLLTFFMGVIYLFKEPSTLAAVFHLSVALYFYVCMYELKEWPFPRWVYILLIVLLVGCGLYYFLDQEQANLINGIACFIFTLMTWSSLRSISNKE
jgi:hypothetical protein